MNRDKRRLIGLIFVIVVSVQPIIGTDYTAKLKNMFSRFDRFLWNTYGSMRNTFIGGTIADFISQYAGAVISGSILVKMMFQQKQQGEEAKSLLTHSITPVTVTDTKLKDYIGVPPAVEILVDQIKNREAYQTVKAPFTKGILLTGNPGTGKSFLARAIAGETQCPFFNVSATEFNQVYVGAGPLMVRELFKNAKFAALKAPSKIAIIFLDELDAIGGRGATYSSGMPSGILQTLLTAMDGFNTITAQDLGLTWYQRMRISGKQPDLPEISIVMFGATNVPGNIDPALRRPGRFDNIIEVGNPDAISREKIAELYLKERPHSPDVEADRLAVVTDGMTPAEIKALFAEAARDAASKKQSHIEIKNFCKALFDTKKINTEKVFEGHDTKPLEILITMYPCDESVRVFTIVQDILIGKVGITIQEIADIFENTYTRVKFEDTYNVRANKEQKLGAKEQVLSGEKSKEVRRLISLDDLTKKSVWSDVFKMQEPKVSEEETDVISSEQEPEKSQEEATDTTREQKQKSSEEGKADIIKKQELEVPEVPQEVIE